MPNKTKVDLNLILDIDMYLPFEKGMRGGVSYISKRYSNASNKYLTLYDHKKNIYIFTTWTKIIHTVMLYQNIFQRTDLSA